ncbi:MAG TPA: phenylalanine--tRNA ligase subunit beta [Candidatus Krumholzibacteriaceae bacterium]|nr:phenylalanine--tRNA ligase subunit beta [Candidatus Krumholzibacteriaceae bacterium]
MPTITLQRERFNKFLGRQLSLEKMAKWLPWLGVDLEEIGPDYVKIEFNPNRVDLCSYAGVARAFKGLMGWQTGLPEYPLKSSKTVLRIDKSVSDIRPYMLAAVVHNIKLDEDTVAELMEIQEDLHWGIGRDRKKASIGMHNLDAVHAPLTFKAVPPDSVRFAPLDKSEEMTLREILSKHEKGLAYKHLVDWAPRYPLLVDKDERVLSMPPIINGELTRVSSDTRNLFLDVTGTDYNAVARSLNILVTALAEMGARIEKVTVEYPDHTESSPNLSPQRMQLRVQYANEMLGLRLTESEAIKCLKKCRLDAKKIGKMTLEVLIPAYRIDVLHEIDLVEEVAIGYGYYRLKPTLPVTVTVGEEHRAGKLAETVRQILIGLGFTEVMNFTLTNEETHYVKMLKKLGKAARLTNPVSSEYTILREELLPGLLQNLMDNRSESFPQRLFEVSDVVKVNMQLESRCDRRLHVAGVLSYAAANFTEIKSIVEALLANLGFKKWQVKAVAHPSFIEGRAACVIVGKKQVGIMGEIHPQVLNNFELENPVAAFELDLEEFC